MANALFGRLEKDECIQLTQNKAPGKTKGVNQAKTNEMLLKVQAIIETNVPSEVPFKEKGDAFPEQVEKDPPVSSKSDTTKKAATEPNFTKQDSSKKGKLLKESVGVGNFSESM